MIGQVDRHRPMHPIGVGRKDPMVGERNLAGRQPQECDAEIVLEALFRHHQIAHLKPIVEGPRGARTEDHIRRHRINHHLRRHRRVHLPYAHRNHRKPVAAVRRVMERETGLLGAPVFPTHLPVAGQLGSHSRQKGNGHRLIRLHTVDGQS